MSAAIWRDVAPVTLATLLWAVAPPPVLAQGSSRSCIELDAGSVEQEICRDDGLFALEEAMQKLLAQAFPKSLVGARSGFAGEQLRWKRGRDDCLNAPDRRQCLVDKYRLRVAEIQARYGLVTASGPFTWVCRELPPDEVVATFFATDPPSLIATRAGKTSFMMLTPGSGGARYRGPHESLQERGQEARITWEPVASEMFCRKKPKEPDVEKP
jgi:uncharacterized protein